MMLSCLCKKPGADENSYIVSVAYDLKYKNIETPAPGLDFFYVPYQ